MGRQRNPHRIIDGKEEKFCKKCGSWKLLDDFCARKGRWDGLNNLCRTCHVEQSRVWRLRNRIRSNEIQNRYYHSHKVDHKARLKAGRAIRKGKIKVPNLCCYCGKPGNLQAHHPNYDEPLEVIFMHTRCHWKHHAVLRNEQAQLLDLDKAA